MKLILILSAICSLSTIGVTGTPIFQLEGESICNALANLAADLNNTATYFHHITPAGSNSPSTSHNLHLDISSSPLTKQLILGLKDMQTIFEDIIATLNMFNSKSPSEAYRLIQPLFSVIRRELQVRITILENKVATGQADEHESRFLIDSLSTALDNVIERLNHSNWRKTCESQSQGSEPVKSDVAASYFSGTSFSG
ncbi:hypothetical protein N7478_003382 [Penicillium angulare]|uniref:uncharacterized protein n=1 Tax=Penicillium angulare TaxID=116970 RepID=UPI002541A12F|nr:uncharacterized protein N7478_003382 [Penicillium angulare]KAJ5287696.1 hypothetical protein N7478_003382 [Penicillium angulare]